MSVSIYQRVEPIMKEPDSKWGWGRSRQRGTSIGTDGTLRPDTYRVDPKTGCIIWLFSMNGKRVPQAVRRTADGSYEHLNVRRMVWMRRFPDDTPPKRMIPGCGNDRCINPEHMIPERTIDTGRIVVLARAGHSIPEIAKATGYSAATVGRILRERGVKAPRKPKLSNIPIRRAMESLPPMARPTTIMPRDWEIFLAAQKQTYAEIGEKFEISRERVRQIVNRVLRDVLLSIHEGERKS